MNMQLLPYILILLSSVLLSLGANIEGSIMAPLDAPPDWAMHTRVRVDGGKFLGFVQRDGHFIVSNVPSGSYLIEFTHPAYLFQPIRVDINSKNKIRARVVNVLKTNSVKPVTYPLRVTSVGRAMFFQPREQLRTLDLLLNPTVLIMGLPLILVMILPKLIDNNDPEFKEMQKMNLLTPKTDMPDISNYLSNMSFLGGKKSTGERGNGGAGRKSALASSASTSADVSSRKGGRKRNS